MSDTHKTESLHDQIMRLPCTPPKDANVNQSISYKSGHRDARHAAAELAAEHEAEQQQELTAIEAMARMLADGEWAEHVGELGGPIAQRLETEITRMHNEQQAAQAAVPDENGLLPCPFCGGKAELHQRETESLWSHNQVTWSQVGCCECECVGADCCEDDDGSEAAAHWNTRAGAPSAPTPPAQETDEQRPAAWIAKYQGSYILDLCLPDADDDRASLDWRPLYTAPPAQQSPLYTCIGKGGRYEKVGSAKPAGIANFEHNIGAVIVYRDIESDHLYFRLPLDFNRRMKRIDDGDTAAPEQAEQQSAWVEQIMEQAQVFASAWSLVGGPFDTGDGLKQAKEEKELLRKLLEAGR
ncbi:Lar family restriction alleviation protein [Azotobacter chroococcum]|uniref:Lar family restriction alleviation protein n=1 Tax=Azotobacter chroococcum TaxID=353 RepID=A0AAP9YHE0_9GAMM|nr:Lar family restriction alleviation protein [Azotobacter chroococcum]QQE90232.1 Lar family restriction alleviation protein [Azotobacter chroococcum]